MRKDANHVLVVGDAGALLLSASHVQFAPQGNTVARAALLAHLNALNNPSITVVFNGRGQDSRADSLPPVNPLDRARLVRRRLAQAYPDAIARGSRVSNGMCRLAGVQENAELSYWLDHVPARATRLAALPCEAAAFAETLDAAYAKGWCLLLLGCRGKRIRHVALRDGELVFSRLTEQPETDHGWLALLRDTRAYLARYGLDAADDVPVAAVGVAGVAGAVSYSPAQEMARWGLAASSDSSGEDVFAAWLRQTRPRLPLRHDGLRLRQVAAWRELWGWRAGMAACVAGVLALGWHGGLLARQMWANRMTERAIVAVHDRMRGEESRLDPSGNGISRLRAALMRQRIFAATQREPWDMLDRFAVVMEDRARVSSLEWQDGLLKMRVRFTVSNDTDHESAAKQLRASVETWGQALPDYTLSVTRYPFALLPQDTLTNQADDAMGGLDVDLQVRRRS